MWEKDGEAGVHRFERYRDKCIRTEEQEDDGTCILSADQQETNIVKAFKSFNVKAFTLEDIEALPMDDEQDAEQREEGEEVDSSEVDSDAAVALEGREYTGLFDRKKVAAAAKPKAAVKGSKTTVHGSQDVIGRHPCKH